MLELHSNRLSFSFPEIAAKLRALTGAHVEAHTAAAFTEDRQASIDRLFQDRWRAHADNPEFRVRAAREAAGFTQADLFAAWHRLAFLEAGISLAPPSSADAGTRGCGIEFQRTLRIPDDEQTHSLPAGLGRFALRSVDDYLPRVPALWRERGGVMMPMYQAEAMWINLHRGYPCAVKIAAGKINAISGEAWRAGLHRGPAQDYVVVPGQPWLDGFSVGKGIIRQFVAMPLGGGHSVEEQLTGEARHGGVQVQVYPLRADVHFEQTIAPRLPRSLDDILVELIDTPELPQPLRSQPAGRTTVMAMPCAPMPVAASAAPPDMGLGAGGRMRQEIYEDDRPLSDWDQELSSRCFVHLCNSFVWREITGDAPPQPPVTAAEYTRHGLPWFDYYDETAQALPGSSLLAKVKSVFQFGKEKGEAALPGEGPVEVKKVIPVGPARRPGEVREWAGD